MRRAVTPSIITLVLAVISGAGAAEAGGRPLGTAVSISNRYEAATSSVCGYHFSYLQRMTVAGGGSAWVPVEFVARPGRYELLPSGDSCEGHDVFVLDTPCGCQVVVLEA